MINAFVDVLALANEIIFLMDLILKSWQFSIDCFPMACAYIMLFSIGSVCVQTRLFMGFKNPINLNRFYRYHIKILTIDLCDILNANLSWTKFAPALIINMSHDI